MVKCPFAANGCNYPEGDCPGHCSVNNGLRQHRPEARRLVDLIERYNSGVHSQAIVEDYCKAAAELRRLHAENEKLKSLCRRSLQALWEDDFPSLRDELRKALGDISD